MNTEQIIDLKKKTNHCQKYKMISYRQLKFNNCIKFIHKNCIEKEIEESIENDAKITFKLIFNCKYTCDKNKDNYIIIRGEMLKNVMMACIFFAYTKNYKPIKEKDIINIFDTRNIYLKKGCKKVISLMMIIDDINMKEKEKNILNFFNNIV